MELSNAERIASGSLLVLLTIEGIDSLSDDPCVRVTLERGTLDGTGTSSPALDSTGRLAPGQTFRVGGSPWVDAAPAAITGGLLELGPLPRTVPLELGFATFPLDQAQLQLEASAEGFEQGVLGGAVDTGDVASAVAIAVSDGVVTGHARSIAEGWADLHPDAIAECRAVSAAFVMEGVRAARDGE